MESRALEQRSEIEIIIANIDLINEMSVFFDFANGG